MSKEIVYFFALLFAPLPHSSSSAAALFWFSTADFAAAASAFLAFPDAFLVFSPAAFLPAILIYLIAQCDQDFEMVLAVLLFYELKF